MGNRIATCPQSKQISGSKTIAGVLPLLNGPLQWKNIYTNAGTNGYTVFSQFGLAGTWTTLPASFVAGDLVLVQHPYSSLSAPAYVVYICVADLVAAPMPEGSRPPGYTGPLYWNPGNFASLEASHWQEWNLMGGAQGGNGNRFVGLGGLPDGFQEVGAGPGRTVWGIFGANPPKRYLTLNYSTVISGSANGGLAIDGTYTHSWSVNKWTGVVVDNGGTDGSNAPAAALPFLFPAIPPNTSGWTPNQTASNNPPPLFSITLAPDGSSISFAFAIQFDGNGNAVWTVTQTVTLGIIYMLAEVEAEALALLNGNQSSSGAMFATMKWGQAATCSYNADGTVQVAIAAMVNSGQAPTSCGSNVTALAASGIGSVNQNLFANAYTFSIAQVDVCGQYGLRTFYCGRAPAVVQCQTGTVYGYNPVTIPPPAFNGTDGFVYSQIFPNCQC